MCKNGTPSQGEEKRRKSEILDSILCGSSDISALCLVSNIAFHCFVSSGYADPRFPWQEESAAVQCHSYTLYIAGQLQRLIF